MNKLYPVKSDTNNIPYTISGYSLKGKITQYSLENVIVWTDNNILYVSTNEGITYGRVGLGSLPQELILSKINNEICVVAATDIGTIIYNLSGNIIQRLSTEYSKKIRQYKRNIYVLTEASLEIYNLDTLNKSTITLNQYSDFYFISEFENETRVCLMFDTYVDYYVDTAYINRQITPFTKIDDIRQYSDLLVLVKGIFNENALENVIIQENLLPIITEDDQYIETEEAVVLLSDTQVRGIFLYDPILNTCEIITTSYNVNLYNINKSAINA